jgi:tetratricopeptide (TPR) repeat protein
LRARLIILFLFPIIAFGQVNVDSLFSIWQDNSQADTVRAKALNRLAKGEYLYSQPDSALHYGLLSYNFSKERDLKEQMCYALNIIGTANSILGNYAEATESYEEALKTGRSINNNNIISLSLRNKGTIFLQRSDYANAMIFYNQALKVSEKSGNKKLIASLYNNIGLIYMDLKDYKESLKYLEQSLNKYREINSPKGISKLLNNIGTIYRFQGKIQKALEYYEESLKLMRKSKSGYAIAVCYNNIGMSNNELGNKQLAADYFHRGLNINKNTGNLKGLSRSLISLGNLYLELKKDSVEEFGSLALKIAQEIGSSEEIADAAELLYNTYKGKGKEKQALRMYELQVHTMDSILSDDDRLAIIRQGIKTEYEKKALKKEIEHEKQMSAGKLKDQKEKFSIIGIFILLIFFSGMYLRIKYMNNLSERDKLFHEIELLKEKSLTKMIAANNSLEIKDVVLDKEKIEKAVSGKLNQTDWNALNVIFKNPSVTNKEIAAEISMSYEGTCSSLRKMYKLFNLKSSRNNKMTLILEATRISNEK